MKGQGAKDYLLSYGWAILIIMVVGVALYALGVLNPESYPKNNQKDLCMSLNYVDASENVTCSLGYGGTKCLCDVIFYNDKGFITGSAQWKHDIPIIQ